jgi:hypothetical protein
MGAAVHAHISSIRRVLRSSWTEVSRGDRIFPSGFSNLATSQKQELPLDQSFSGPWKPLTKR